VSSTPLITVLELGTNSPLIRSFYFSFSICSKDTQTLWTATMASPGPASETPGQKAARERRERREAKMGGNTRLDKITALSGRTPESGMFWQCEANSVIPINHHIIHFTTS
jgi:hypothetical protein